MADDIDARIGRNLRSFRQEAGLDIDALAGRTGLQSALIERYEAGLSRVPVGVLSLLAEELARPISEFFA